MIRKTISLTEHQVGWLRVQITGGQFATESEVIRNLIRREVAKEHKRELITAALIEAERLGFDPASFEDVVNNTIARAQRQDAV